MSYSLIFSLGQKVLSGDKLSFAEALSLTAIENGDIPLLLGVANKVRQTFNGDAVDTCEIVSARAGNCSENCKFCAQSAHHQTTADTYPLLSEDKLVAAAINAQNNGSRRFSLVTSGKGMIDDPEFDGVLAAIKRIKRETALGCCCSLGLLTKKHFQALKEAGITRYHHNLEAGPSFFPHICTTHTYEDRVTTIKAAKEAGLEVCSGGIIGLGENWRERLELAFALRELNVDSIPVNILSPVAGTPLANQSKLRPLEIFQTFAIFRLILPDKIIRYAGGREYNLGDLVPIGFIAGLNGVLTGDYLTTSGRGVRYDLHNITTLELKV